MTQLSSPATARTTITTVNVDSAGLRQRVQEAAARQLSADPATAVAGAASATTQLTATASLVWSALPPERVVPPYNTYGASGLLSITQTPTTSRADALSNLFPKLESAWAQPPEGDAISSLMERNYTRSKFSDLAGQWSGLGKALLSRAAQPSTGPVQYEQSYLSGADKTLSLKTQFGQMQIGATTVHLQIKTRSGQTVDLQIAANNKVESPGGASSHGLQVSVSTSAPLSDTERQALADLSEGLEEALAGLGGSDQTPEMKLSGLLNYDRSVFSQLSLDVKNPTHGAALEAFALTLGDGGNSLSYDGSAGKLDLRLDATPPLPAGSTEQRQAAIAQQLQRIDAAAERSHADEKLVALFKSSFSQLHGAAPIKPTEKPLETPGPINAEVADEAQAMLSGLVDFEASFSGDFTRVNRWGSVNEQGHAQYAISQKTQVETDDKRKTATIVQVQNEQLQSTYAKARHGGALDLSSGNFDRHTIQDSNTTTTAINIAKGKIAEAVRSTDTRQMKTEEMLVKHRVMERHETPNHQRLVTQLV